MANTIEVIDHLGDVWTFLAPVEYDITKCGFVTMWAWVMKGPASLTTGGYRYQSIPLPVFTGWWEPLQ